jgi:putative ABC transport system permease protein
VLGLEASTSDAPAVRRQRGPLLQRLWDGPRGLAAVIGLRFLVHRRSRLASALLGALFAAYLMAMEAGLLTAFMSAASRMVRAVDADLWLGAPGLPAFDFASGISARHADLAMAAPGARVAGSANVTWAPLTRHDGARRMVMVVGVDPPFVGAVPDVRGLTSGTGSSGRVLMVDRSDLSTLGVERLPSPVELGGKRASIGHVTQGFSTFLGTPLVMTDAQSARESIGLPPDRVSFVLLKLQPGADARQAQDFLAKRLPEVSVWRKDEFARQTSWFWLNQTGAGAALSVAALLGFVIGLVMVSQTIYALTVESIEDYAVLVAMGATTTTVKRAVRAQALLCSCVGGLMGLALAIPSTALTRYLVSWAEITWPVLVVVFAVVILMAFLAASIATRPALTLEPARVFRV